MTPHLALPWAAGLEISRTSMFHRRIIEPLEGGYRLFLDIFCKTVISFLLFLDACIFLQSSCVSESFEVASLPELGPGGSWSTCSDV